jgi:hypothetical protein
MIASDWRRKETNTLMNEPPTWPSGPPTPAPPRRKRHVLRWIAAGIAGFTVLVIAIAAAAGGGKTTPAAQFTPARTISAPAATTTAPAAPAVPSPAGKATGSCDYSLADTVTGTDYLTAEVDLDNTGNVGTVVKVTVSWPQEGFEPITATKTARVPYGASGQPVRFHVAASTDVISRLQSWQERHDTGDPCQYSNTITATFGAAH